MKVGDLIRVRYEPEGEWYHGVIMTTPFEDPLAVWRMWCIERSAPHILAPSRDEIEVIGEM